MTKHNTAIEWTHIPGYKGETWNPIVGVLDGVEHTAFPKCVEGVENGCR